VGWTGPVVQDDGIRIAWYGPVDALRSIGDGDSDRFIPASEGDGMALERELTDPPPTTP